MPMGAAPMALHPLGAAHGYDPRDPELARPGPLRPFGRPRLDAALPLLHLTGYDLLDDIKRFRQWGRETPGHPEAGSRPAWRSTTGPLGQGFANAVGMAIAERSWPRSYNRPGYDIVDHYTYALFSDGDLMEGISAEAASLAGHLGLGKLIVPLRRQPRLALDARRR